DETTKTSKKVAALARYFAAAPPADAAWAIYFLAGRKPPQAVPSRRLRQWAIEAAGVPDWLFDESYHAVGDVAETIALLLPPAARSAPEPVHYWAEAPLLPLRRKPGAGRRASSPAAWGLMGARPRCAGNEPTPGRL